MIRWLRFIGLMSAIAASPNLEAAVTLEYIGHACFVIESSSGARVVVDPFASTRWLGYQFPNDVPADAVLVSHPHYDHDASYYWGDSVPVFRKPGEYLVSDIRVIGVEGRHADPYGKDFRQKNTLWVIESGGVRILHMGDNGPLTEENIAAIGSVDVLMVPADGDDHILKPAEIAAAESALSPRLVVPMHYRLDGFLGLPSSLGPVEPWLEPRDSVMRLESNRLTVDDDTRPGTVRFQPSTELRVWPDGLAEGWQLLDEARERMEKGEEDRKKAFELVRRANEAFPSVVFGYQWARALGEAKRYDEATRVLQSAIAGAVMDDWEYRARAHALLGNLFEISGDLEGAQAQYRWVLQHSYRTELLEQAREFLEKR